ELRAKEADSLLHRRLERRDLSAVHATQSVAVAPVDLPRERALVGVVEPPDRHRLARPARNPLRGRILDGAIDARFDPRADLRCRPAKLVAHTCEHLVGLIARRNAKLRWSRATPSSCFLWRARLSRSVAGARRAAPARCPRSAGGSRARRRPGLRRRGSHA